MFCSLLSSFASSFFIPYISPPPVRASFVNFCKTGGGRYDNLGTAILIDISYRKRAELVGEPGVVWEVGIEDPSCGEVVRAHVPTTKANDSLQSTVLVEIHDCDTWPYSSSGRSKRKLVARYVDGRDQYDFWDHLVLPLL